MKEIVQLLNNWRQERNITIEYQQAGLIANLSEEITEYLRAKDDNERIDALCDIIVFSLNSINPTEAMLVPVTESLNYPVSIFKSMELLCSEPITVMGINFIISISCKEIENLGYNPKQCMLETINEISSRTGYIDKSINKFVKHKGAYTFEDAQKIANEKYIKNEDGYWVFENCKIKQWYKADYNKCRNI